MTRRKTLIEADYRRLSALARAVRQGGRPERAEALDRSLNDSLVFSEGEIAVDFVAMGSVARLRTPQTGETFTYRLVFPVDGDISRGQLSVLSPLGAALLGRRAGEAFSYDSPGGEQTVIVDAVEGHPPAEGQAEPHET